jgi:hypothetical protein
MKTDSWGRAGKWKIHAGAKCKKRSAMCVLLGKLAAPLDGRLDEDVVAQFNAHLAIKTAVQLATCP